MSTSEQNPETSSETTASGTVAVEEVVDLVASLIRFDTTNTGDPATTVGERECAEWVARQLEEVGYETEYVESGAPGRGNVFARLPGADRSRGALLVHGHLDVVPADASEWTVDPFAGEIRDGVLWGRGAVDMKDMDAMILASVAELLRAGEQPERDLVLVFFADEENGGVEGSQLVVRDRALVFVEGDQGAQQT